MKTAPWIIIIILIAVIFFLRECTPVHECPVCPELRNDTVYDSIPYPVISYKPRIVFRDTGSYHRIPLTKQDSINIVQFYFETNYYADTIADSTHVFVLVEDSVSQNQITWRRKTVRVFPATIYTTQIVTKQADPRRMMYVGLGVGRSMQSFGLAPSLLYISKRQSAYSLSYDLLNKDAYFTMFFKLQFKK